MMNRFSFVFTIAAVAVSGLGLQVSDSCFASDLMSPDTAARMGLEEVWRQQMSVPYGADSIVDQQIFAHKANPREYIEVVTKPEEGKEGVEPEVLFRIPTDMPDQLGEPIGKEEAERLARRERRRLTRRHGELEIQSQTRPRIMLYTLASSGTVDCRDAETGAPVWRSTVGKPRLNFGKMGIDDQYLTLTNGGNLIQLDVTNGEPIETVLADNVPLFGALNSGEYAIVPTIRNGIEAFPLSDITVDAFMEIVSGIAMVPPVKSPSSPKIAWGTDRGFVYVMETSGNPSLQFRLNTDGNVGGSIAAADGDRFFFGSDTGQAYAIRASRSGIVLWTRPYGEPFYKPAFLLGKTVLMPSEYGNLFALDQQTGLQIWDNPVPNVDRILGGFGGRVYVRQMTGEFAVLDAETGAMLDAEPSLRVRDAFVNRVTDRLYLVNNLGTVQCLRRIGAETPTLRVTPDVADETAEQADAKKDAGKAAEPGFDPFQSRDPFGGTGGDPFGAGDAAMDDDPFGAGDGAPMDDPFGAPAGNAMDDPFGDPFGN